MSLLLVPHVASNATHVPSTDPSADNFFQTTLPCHNLVNILSSVRTAAHIGEATGHRRTLQAEAAAHAAVN